MTDFFEQIVAHDLYATVSNFIREYDIFSNIMHIDIALSGGADSVCLAALLATYRKTTGGKFTLRAHHIRHGLRNDARDAEISKITAYKLNLPHIQTNLNLYEVKRNVEAEARTARYEAFFRTLAHEQNPALALAHHGDENVETAVWRIGRGCGSEGVCMPPVRLWNGVRIARPLLGVSKTDICQFLRDVGFEWVEDPTNNDDTYTRNRIRHEVLPPIMQTSTTKSVVYRSLLNVAQDAESVCAFAESYARAHQIDDATFYISRLEWEAFPLCAQSQILRQMARKITPRACPDHDWIMRALAMIRTNSQTFRQYSCGSMAIFLSSRGFCATTPNRATKMWHPFDITSADGTPFDVAGLGSLSLFYAAPCAEIPNAPDFASFRMTRSAALRLSPACAFKTLSTSDRRATKTREALRCQGVPTPLRETWPILCDGDTPLWIVGGMRTADAPKARPNEMALFVRWTPKIVF